MTKSIDDHIGIFASPFVQAAAYLPFAGSFISYEANKVFEGACDLTRLEGRMSPSTWKENTLKIADLQGRYALAELINNVLSLAILISSFALDIISISAMPVFAPIVLAYSVIVVNNFSTYQKINDLYAKTLKLA